MAPTSGPRTESSPSHEVWFPKDLRRDPVTVDTGGARDWRFIALNPPATVSKLLIRVAETSDPP